MNQEPYIEEGLRERRNMRENRVKHSTEPEILLDGKRLWCCMMCHGKAQEAKGLTRVYVQPTRGEDGVYRGGGWKWVKEAAQ